jgi:hypothetical protein
MLVLAVLLSLPITGVFAKEGGTTGGGHGGDGAEKVTALTLEDCIDHVYNDFVQTGVSPERAKQFRLQKLRKVCHLSESEALCIEGYSKVGTYFTIRDARLACQESARNLEIK